MEETPSNHPGIPEETYHTLGKKTLMIFVLQRIQTSFILLILAIVLFGIQGQEFLIQTPAGNIAPYVSLTALIVLGIFVISFLLGFFIAWLIYINYKFSLEEDSLKIKRGILNKEEIAIPYRQIQDVDITRDLSFLMLGLSRIAILTAGHEDQDPEKKEAGQSEGFLPALDKDLAEWLQAELLKRANIQKVVESPKDSSPTE
jgi:uncharacterized membrane protein YdbT with pleckstrin-like domain